MAVAIPKIDTASSGRSLYHRAVIMAVLYRDLLTELLLLLIGSIADTTMSLLTPRVIMAVAIPPLLRYWLTPRVSLTSGYYTDMVDTAYY